VSHCPRKQSAADWWGCHQAFTGKWNHMHCGGTKTQADIVACFGECKSQASPDFGQVDFWQRTPPANDTGQEFSAGSNAAIMRAAARCWDRLQGAASCFVGTCTGCWAWQWCHRDVRTSHQHEHDTAGSKKYTQLTHLDYEHESVR
jgi:hypothetical protein